MTARSMASAFDCGAAEVLGRDVLPFLEGADVGDEGPDLIGGEEGAPGGHPFGAALVDRLVDFSRRAAEVPAAVGETRPHRAATVRAVAVDAVVRDEQLRPR